MTRPTHVMVSIGATRQRWNVESIGPRFVTLYRRNAVRVFDAGSGRMLRGVEATIVDTSMRKLRPFIARERCGRAR